MALFRKFFSRKPPNGLLEISERIYVFDCCFTTDILEEEEFNVYTGRIVSQLPAYFLDSSFMVFNFREGEHQNFLSEVLSAYDMTVMDYPWHYEGCPLLTMEMIHHFLRSSESWYSLSHQNILLMHCERGGWPVLAFMLAGLLIYRKQYTGEQKTLDMIYKQAPRELLQLLSPLNPMPSQIRYLQYIARRNISSVWPPLDRALMLDCVILRFIPNFDGEGGCRPLFRIYGQDPLISEGRTPKVLFSTLKRSKFGQLYKQADCELVKIDIHCHIQGDVVLECINLDDDLKSEVMMFRVMFNTAFITSNILMLNRNEIDIMWNAKDRFMKNFRAEVLFSELDASNSVNAVELSHIVDKDNLPIETFANMQEIFSNLVWIDSKGDATLHGLQQMPTSCVSKENQDTVTPQKATTEFMPQKSPDFLMEKLLRSKYYDVSTISSLITKQNSVSSLKHSFDTSTMSLSSLIPSVPVFHPTQPKKIYKFLESPQTSPVSLTNSLQSSPTHISRYHSTPSAMRTLGITALLHDHDVLGRAAHSMTSSLSAPSLFPGETSAMPERAVTKTASPTTPLSASQPPLLPLPPLPSPLEVPSHASVPILVPLSPSASLPSSESPLKNSQVTSITPNLFSAVTTEVNSISLSTSARTPSSCLLPSMSQTIPPPSPPPLLSPPPPLISSSRKRSFPSLAEQNSTDDTEIAASVPPISIIYFPAEGKEYKTSSPTKTTAFSAANHEASSPVKGLSAAAPTSPPPPSLHASSTLSSFAPSTNTCVLPPPPHAISGKYIPSTDSLPPLPSSPPTINKTDLLFTAPPPPLPSPSTININGPSTIPLLTTRSYSQSSSYPLSSKVENIFAPQPSPMPSCFVLPSTLAPPPCHPSQDSGSPDIQTVPPPSVFLKGLSPSSGPPPPPSVLSGIKGQILARTKSNNSRNLQSSAKRISLKPLHWVKVTRAVQGSLWAEAQKSDEASEAPEFDISELEGLFSAAVPNSQQGSGDKLRGLGKKYDRVQLIDLQRANNCEIMLTKVKISLTDLLNSVLALDETVLDVDQVDNLIKFCPTESEMELLKNFNGDKERLGKCEQYFLELMKVPRVESKLRVFSFKIKFRSQVAGLSENLNIINSASQEIRSSVRLKRIMQAILSLGNTINRGTARGSAIGFKLDSVLKLNDTHARNSKMTLMHYLCKVLVEKLPELLTFPKDLVSLEIASKIQLNALAEEMQAISKGLENVEKELISSENDGPVSEIFCKTLKDFLVGAEEELRALTSRYSTVGRSADALALYFGEDPAHYPFEQVVNTLLGFVKAFVQAHEENCKQLELEKRKQQKRRTRKESSHILH